MSKNLLFDINGFKTDCGLQFGRSPRGVASEELAASSVGHSVNGFGLRKWILKDQFYYSLVDPFLTHTI